MSKSPIPLQKLEAHVSKVTLCGETFEALWFECPNEACEHPVMVPFHKTQRQTTKGKQPIWAHDAGTTPDDLTLSPSVRSRTPPLCEIHGWVRNGAWHFC